MIDQTGKQRRDGVLEVADLNFWAACEGHANWYEIHWYANRPPSKWTRMRLALVSCGLLAVLTAMAISLIGSLNHHGRIASSHPTLATDIAFIRSPSAVR
jgi:hypothetical protein